MLDPMQNHIDGRSGEAADLAENCMELEPGEAADHAENGMDKEGEAAPDRAQNQVTRDESKPSTAATEETEDTFAEIHSYLTSTSESGRYPSGYSKEQKCSLRRKAKRLVTIS